MTDQTQHDTEAAVARIREFQRARAHWIDEPDGVPIRSYTLPARLGEKAQRAYLNDDDLTTVLAALDSAQGRAAALQVELDSEGHQICLDWQKMRAERDRLAARVAELEAEHALLHTEYAASHPRDGHPDCRHDDYGINDEAARLMTDHTPGWYLEHRLVGPWTRHDETRPA